MSTDSQDKQDGLDLPFSDGGLIVIDEKLADMGIVESEPNIRNKLARGTFSAVFLVQCLMAIGAKSIDLTG